MQHPPQPPLFPYTTLFRSQTVPPRDKRRFYRGRENDSHALPAVAARGDSGTDQASQLRDAILLADRKSTRLNSSHTVNSYAVFCLKKKKEKRHQEKQQQPR